MNGESLPSPVQVNAGTTDTANPVKLVQIYIDGVKKYQIAANSVDTPLDLPAGSVLFYTGALYHGAGANRSRDVRCGLNVTYSVSWLRQEENQYLSVPAEIARTLPDDLLRLMGYRRGAYALGYVDDLRDPLDALRGVVKNEIALGDLDAATARVRERLG